MTPADPRDPLAILPAITTELGKVFIGQERLIELVLAALLARGHLLVEGVPGLGKTLLVKALGRVLGLTTGRIQFTPDLMPADITGSHVFDLATREFVFRPGPVFTNYLLADEFNRAPAKTHAALLEVMQECQVTLDGNRYPLTPPFLVLATQNPIESEGTYHLPEAQLDRFLFKVVLAYPTAEEERDILDLHRDGRSPDHRLADLTTLLDAPRLLALQDHAERVAVHETILDYITAIIRLTREWPGVTLGASPRAGIALLQGARGLAMIRGRGFVIPDDVADIARPVLRHRLILSPEAEVDGRTADGIVGDILVRAPVPRGQEALPVADRTRG
jgi:MoxR-like ATPase